jgi:hypothetical protein
MVEALADAASCRRHRWARFCFGFHLVFLTLLDCGKPAEAATFGEWLSQEQGDQKRLLTQEIDELRSYVGLCKTRINLLKELREVVKSGYNVTESDAHFGALTSDLPMLSDIEVHVDKAASAASEDYFISKAVISQDEEIKLIKFMPLRTPRTSSSSSSASQQSTMPAALLVAAQPNGMVRLFTPTGDLVLSFSGGHEHPVTHLATSQSQDEYLVITGDSGGTVRIHKINVRQRRPSKKHRKGLPEPGEEKHSQYLGLQSNATHSFFKEMKLLRPDEASITSLTMASQQGSKYFVAGSSDGKINIFTKNGTLYKAIDVAKTVPSAGDELKLHAQLSSLLFSAGGVWGYVDLERFVLRVVKCPSFEGRIQAIIFDSQQASRILASDEAGTIWVFNVKNKQECKVEHRFTQGATRGEVDLGSMRGFTLALERRPDALPALVAVNMSHVGKKKHELGSAPSPVVWRRIQGPTRSWTVHKRHQQGDLIAFLSADGHEIEIAELLMQVYTPPSTENPLGNFKMPVIAVAVMLVLGYQYMKNKGGKGGDFDPSILKGGGGGRRGGLAGKLGELGKARRGMGGGLGGRGGLGRRF